MKYALQSLIAVAVFALAGTFPAAHAAPAAGCEINDSGPARIVKFSSGRTMGVIGHSHGLTGEVMQLARLADDTETPNDRFLLTAALTLRSLLTTHDEFRAEVKYLRAKILAGEINFIALEYGDKIMEMMTAGSQNFLPMARENFKKRGLSNDVLLDAAFLVFAGPAHYLAETEPELMKNVRIVAVEDDDLMQRSLDAQVDAETRLETFNEAAKNLPEARALLEKSYARAVLEYDLHRFLDDAWIMGDLEKQIPAPLLTKAKDTIASALAAAELLRARDKKSFPKFLAEGGSGVLLIGSAHARSISHALKLSCEKE